MLDIIIACGSCRDPQPKSKLRGTKLTDVMQTYRLYIAHDARNLSCRI